MIALRQEEAGGERAILAGRAHDDGERAAVQPDVERLLGRRDVASCA